MTATNYFFNTTRVTPVCHIFFKKIFLTAEKISFPAPRQTTDLYHQDLCTVVPVVGKKSVIPFTLPLPIFDLVHVCSPQFVECSEHTVLYTT